MPLTRLSLLIIPKRMPNYSIVYNLQPFFGEQRPTIYSEQTFSYYGSPRGSYLPLNKFEPSGG
jgi:hypothetical protein